MSARTGVLCAGSVVADVAKVIDACPALDHLATIEQVSTGTGGPGLNMAVDLRLLGATFGVGMLGAVGDDLHGDVILAECAKLDIDTTSVARIPGAVTSFTDVMVERDGGRRTFFHRHGANAIFDGATADLGQSQARILHAGVDSLIINELEAGALTGLAAPVPTADGPVDWATLERMALRLIDHGVSTLAVVHFPAGCVAAARAGAPGGKATSGCPARRSAAPRAPATPSPRASSSARTRAGRSTVACVSAPHRPQPASAARTPPTASRRRTSASPPPTVPDTAEPTRRRQHG